MTKASWRRRAAALISGLAMIVAGAVVASPAAADTAPLDPTNPRTPVTLAADGLPTVQIDGVVWSQVTVGNTVYVAGSFTTARPAGAAPGVNTVPRHNLLAYDITTGNLITSFDHDLNGQALGITKSPDGSRIYVTGDFTQVDGEWHVRIAAFDTATGALISAFRPVLGARGYAVAASDTAVYVGGNFTSVASRTGGTLEPHAYLAGFDATTGDLLPAFTADANDAVLALTVPPAQQMLVAGGRFTTINGGNAYGLGAVNLSTGALMPFPTNQYVRDAGADSAILSLYSDSTGIYGSGYHYGGGGNLEGPFRADPVTGELIWVADCHGDTYSTFPIGPALYVASHQHYCGNIPDGFPQTSPWTFHFGTAFTLVPTGVNTPDIYGYPDHPGEPAPSLLTWYPQLYTGTYTGQGQAGWSVTGNDHYLSFGGEFPGVNGQPQQGLVRFTTVDRAPNLQGPRVRGADFNPTLMSLTSGTMRVSWPGNWDRDNETLTYRLYRDTQTQDPVYEETVTQKEWERGVMGFVDTGLTPGSSVRYRITAADPFGNVAQSEWISGTVSSTDTLSTYAQTVLGDSPSSFWPLGEPSGSMVYDWSGFDDARAGTGVTRGGPSAVGDSNASSHFDGTSNGLAATQVAQDGPQVFSVEAWFRTTSTAGGKIVGFGNRNTGNSSSYDRHIYMQANGAVTFGVWLGSAYTVSSAPGYNDGQWHHVVGTVGPGGEAMYLDGVRVGLRTDATGAQVYSGYWRVGGDTSWSGANYFQGDIDDVAVYPTVLSYQQVVNHWEAAGRTSTLPPVPSDSYGAAVQGLQPDLYWRLDETTGTIAQDTGWSASTGTYRSGYTLGVPGALTGVSGDTAVTFNGTNGLLSGNRSYTNPRIYSEELWFKTTTTNGGKLIGFGNRQTGTSTNYDRHVYMENSGRLTFGVYTGTTTTITSPDAYNDGQWHYLVATQSSAGMALYVDGALVGTNPQTGAQNYTGYWRVGGDTTWGPQPWFAGTIDEVAIYPTALTAAQVTEHYALGTANHPPTAAFTTATDFLSLTADASSSSDPEGGALTYAWNFGDGASGTGATTSHTYAADGTYTVSLTVTDPGGLTGTVTHDVTVVANRPPTALFTTATNFLSVSVDGSGSSDPEGGALSYAWDFGDGSTGSGATTSHTYASAGTYTVSLTVTDPGGLADTTTYDVTVAANQSPTAAFTATPAGLSVSVDGSGSSDPEGGALSYVWDFGDGSTGSGATTSHTYASAGTYTISLTVTDPGGLTDTVTHDATVAVNQAPTAAFTATPAGLSVSVDGSGSSDPEGGALSY
ncbi:PKD domain-containing protein, partial [Isoptericola sp. b490]